MEQHSSIVTVSKFLTKTKCVLTSASAAVLAVVLLGVTLTLAAATSHAQQGNPLTSGASGANGGIPPQQYVDPVALLAAQDKRMKDAQVEYGSKCTTPELRAGPLCQSIYRIAFPGATPEGMNPQCERRIAEVEDARKTLKKTCSDGKWGSSTDCITKLKRCETETQEAADESESTDDFTDALCNSESHSLVKKCNYMDSLYDDRDYRQEEKDAETERKAAKTDVDSLMDQQTELKQKLLAAQREQKDAADKAELEVREEERNIAESVKNALKSVSEGQKKALEQAMEAFAQIEQQYLSMKAEMRSAQTDLVQATNDLETKCRGDARKSLAEAEKARLAAQARGKRNPGTSAALAGYSNRMKKSQDTQKRFDYVQFFNDCVADGQPSLRTMQRRYDDKLKSMNEKADFIEKRRAEMLQKLKEMEASASAQEQEAQKVAMENLNRLGERYTLMQQQNSSKMQQLVQENAIAQQSIQTKLASANQDMQKYAQESLLAKRRGLCGAGSTSRSGDNARDSRSNIAGDWSEAQTSCERMKTGCYGGSDASAQAFCDSISDKVADQRYNDFRKKTDGASPVRK